jgi:glutathione peroxidase
MKKYYSILLLMFCVFAMNTILAQKSIYDFKVQDINGDVFDFSKYEGYKIMIVNTASKCGLTPQYEQLEEIYKQNADSKFIILGFPSNDFLKQEPGSDTEIAEFCQKNYGVSFPMMSKVIVKGDDKCELYKYLTSKALNGLEDSEVKWNFQKYLIGRDGKLEQVISPKVKPNDSKILEWIVAE